MNINCTGVVSHTDGYCYSKNNVYIKENFKQELSVGTGSEGHMCWPVQDRYRSG